MNTPPTTTESTILEEQQPITDRVGQAVEEIKVEIRASEVRIIAAVPEIVKQELTAFFKPFVDIVKYAGSLFLKK